ncbi:hypothetical protein [Leucobacter sp.]
MKIFNLAVACAAVLIVAIVAWGLVVADIPASYRACEGDIVDMDACTSATLGRTIFGAAVTTSGIIAAAVVGGALLVRHRDQK